MFDLIKEVNELDKQTQTRVRGIIEAIHNEQLKLNMQPRNDSRLTFFHAMGFDTSHGSPITFTVS